MKDPRRSASLDAICALATTPRTRLSLAAVELVAELGYEQTGVDAICARAGVHAEAFYELFCDLEACLLGAFEDFLVQARERVLPARSQEAWQDLIATGLRCLLAFFDQEPALARFAVVDALLCSPAVRCRRAQALARAVRVVDAGRLHADPLLCPEPARAERLVLSVISVLQESLLLRSPVPLATLAAPLTGLIVLPYLGAEAARAVM